MEEPSPGYDSVNELRVNIIHQSKLYPDDTSWFPTRRRSGNQYIMVAYHYSNVILVELFASQNYKHRLAAYNIIMQRLKYKKLLVDFQILDNEYNKEYKLTMKEKQGIDHQLVPPDIHRRNAANISIRTLKAHLLATLSGVAHDFPRHLWDLLMPQAELTLNLLQQETANPAMSAWEFFSRAFNYDETPLGPLGICVIVHTNTTSRCLWEFCGKDGWIVGVTLKLYQ